MGFFEIQAFEQTVSILQNFRILLNFVRFIYIDPEQLNDIYSFKRLFIFVC